MTFDYTKITFGGHVQENIKTLDGHKVVLLGITEFPCDKAILGTIRRVGEHKEISLTAWALDGVNHCVDNHNLVMFAPKRKLNVWLNISPSGIIGVCETREAAITISKNTPLLARVHREIEFEEGEGL